MANEQKNVYTPWTHRLKEPSRWGGQEGPLSLGSHPPAWLNTSMCSLRPERFLTPNPSPSPPAPPVSVWAHPLCSHLDNSRGLLAHLPASTCPSHPKSILHPNCKNNL